MAINFLTGIRHLKKTKEYFEDFIREAKSNIILDSATKSLAMQSNILCPSLQLIVSKIDWCFNNLITNPKFDKDITDMLKQEWNSDSFVEEAILEKIRKLHPQQRDDIETIIDTILKGETFQVEMGAEPQTV